MIDVTLPDGRSLSVDAPDAQTAAQAAKAFLDKEAAQQRIQSEAGPLQTVDNAVRSIATGVPIVGGAMDEISAGLNTGFGYLGDYGKELAYQRERDKQYAEQHPYLSTAGNLAGGIMGTITGLRAIPASAVPATMAGKIGAGTLAGGTVAGAEGYVRGEGGNQNRIASALTAAPIGAAVGGLAGPVGAGIGALISRGAKTVAPSFDQLKTATRAAYQKIHDLGIQYDPAEFSQMVKNATARFRGGTQEGQFFPEQSPVSNARLSDLQKMAQSTPEKFDPYTGNVKAAVPTPPPTFEQLDSIRQGLGAILRSKIPKGAENSQEMAAAATLKEHLDNFMSHSPLVGPSASEPGVNASIKTARDLAQRLIKQDQLDIMIGKAQGYKSGVDNGLRLQFEGLLKKLEVGIQRQHNPNWTKVDGWTRDEVNAIKDVAQGKWGRNFAMTVGRGGFDFGQKGNIAALLPSALANVMVGGTHAFLTGGGQRLTSALLGATAIGGASAAKVGARKATEAAVKRAETMVRAGPTWQATAAALRTAADQKKRIAQALLTTQGARVAGTAAPAFVAGR